ncbi:MAG: TolC family protein [bacterium]
MYKKSFLIIIFFLLINNCVSSQQVLKLTDAIDIALGESYNVKSAKFSLINSEKSLEAAKLGLMSSVDLEFDLPDYNRSLASKFNTTTGSEQFYSVGYTTLEGRLYINQPIIFTNGTFSVVGSMFGREQFSDNTPKTKDYFSNLSIRLQQPLFTFNSQKANLERAELNLKKTQRNYSQTEKDIIYQVTSSFFRLFQLKKNAEITTEKVNQTEESYNTAANKLKAGLIAEVEALQLEVDLATAKNELLNVQNNYQEEKNNFKLLIGLPLSDDFDIEADLKFVTVQIDLEEAIESALKNRPDYLNSDDEIYLSGLNIDEVDSKRTIKANLVANYGINKNDSEFDKIFNNFADTRSVVLTVSVPVWDWGQNSREVEAAEANYKLQELNRNNLKESIINEIGSAVNRIKSAKARVEVLSRSVEVAEKSYNISLERFKTGTITSFDLSQMQLRLTDAKLNSLSALIDYNIAVANLERKTFIKY